MKLPVPSDARRLAERLAAEECDLVEQLAALEARVRRFADVERPAYASWRRLEFGPLLATLQELAEELRMRSVLADRVRDLVEREGLHPREALHVLTHPDAYAASSRAGFDPDEVEARRRAKLERKRAQRRAAKRTKRAAERPADAARATARPARVVDLYRALARRIHPDSPRALRNVAPDRLGALWADVQDAYETGSVDRLLAISAWVETLAEAGGGARAERATPGAIERGALLSFSERYERLRGLRRSRRALERKLTELRADPAWEFAEQRPGARRRLGRQARAAIDDEIARVRSALEEVDELIDSMGPPRAPRPVRRR